MKSLALSVRCPYCGAEPSAECVTSAGNPRTPHGERYDLALDTHLGSVEKEK